jgi:hypothetical protein
LADQLAKEYGNEAPAGVAGPVGEARVHEIPPAHAPSGFEWKTRTAIFGMPLICIAYGRDGGGKIRVAKGILAIGQYALGGIVVAQFGAGLLAIGQFVAGVFVIGQLALGLVLAAGQISCGLMAIGQVVVGVYGLGQIGFAEYLWSQGRADMEAVSMFYTIKMMILQEGGITFGEVVKGALDWGSQTLRPLFK